MVLGIFLIGPCQAAGGSPLGLTTERNIMSQRSDLEEVSHPLHEAYACLLSNGLDGAGEALRILVNEASRIERAQ